MSGPTREEMEAQIQVFQSRRSELRERKERLGKAFDMEPALADRALQQLYRDQEEFDRDLMEFKELMKEHNRSLEQ
ncbi:MAG: hypothetical protein KC800_30425 [Candidatus Eremiobacteraeota bacterium]|nr:hypothetical protein [Candidatus Eremiobacteraeota bacterium]